MDHPGGVVAILVGMVSGWIIGALMGWVLAIWAQ